MLKKGEKLKRISSGISVSILLVSMLTLAYYVPSVRADGIVYIRPDGSIDPPSAPIVCDGSRYMLKGNVHAQITVEREGILIDGGGYRVYGGGWNPLNDTAFVLWRNEVTIQNARMDHCFIGIMIATISDNNIIRGNNIENSGWYGILLGGSGSRTYHNNFIDNTGQISCAGVHTWDDGYPSGGNYWSDYTGDDLYSGPNQDQPGSDGIGDTPYVINAYNQDRYPLMNARAWSQPDLAISSQDISFYPQKPKPDQEFEITALVHNIGYGCAENVNVSLLINDEEVQRGTVNVAAGETAPKEFSLSLASGTFSVKIKLDPDNKISEIREDNNSAEKQIQIYLTPVLKNALLIDVYPIPMAGTLLDAIKDDLEEMGYYVNVETDDDITAAWLAENLGGWGVVFWRAHGSGQSTVAIQTVEKYGPGECYEDWDAVLDTYREIWRNRLPPNDAEARALVNKLLRPMRLDYGVGTDYYVGISPSFVSYFCGPSSFPDSLIYVEACDTLLGQDYFYQNFSACGAAAYVGYKYAPTLFLGPDCAAWLAFTFFRYAYNVGTVCDSLVPDLDFRGCRELQLIEGISTNSLGAFVRSPATIQITDPFGRRTGIDPNTGMQIVEIPGSRYFGNGSEPQGVFVPSAMQGVYTITLSGTSNGTYHASTFFTYEGSVTSHNYVGNISENELESFKAVMNHGIQEAINQANPGEMIYVSPGTYHENVVVNKTVSLVGSHGGNCIVNASESGNVFSIIAENVTVDGFVIRGAIDTCCGICLYSNLSRISHNTIMENGYGIGVGFVSDNRIYNNNFINNTRQFDGYNLTNAWDEGYPSGGNYWDDYVGADANKDGIGDTTYSINGYYQDNYPLVSPWVQPNVTVAGIMASKTIIGRGFDLSVNVTITNHGSKAEGLDVAVSLGSKIACTQYVILSCESTATVSFTLNTTSFAIDDYALGACALTPSEDVGSTDASNTLGAIRISVPGDVDGDFDVDIFDVVQITSRYGKIVPAVPPDSHPDIDGNGVVNIFDVVICTGHYGQKWP